MCLATLAYQLRSSGIPVLTLQEPVTCHSCKSLWGTAPNFLRRVNKKYIRNEDLSVNNHQICITFIMLPKEPSKLLVCVILSVQVGCKEFENKAQTLQSFSYFISGHES